MSLQIFTSKRRGVTDDDKKLPKSIRSVLDLNYFEASSFQLVSSYITESNY